MPTHELPTTQRAYTLRLKGVDPKDDTWRDALWATHEAVNKGAKAFGEMLAPRGGERGGINRVREPDQRIDDAAHG